MQLGMTPKAPHSKFQKIVKNTTVPGDCFLAFYKFHWNISEREPAFQVSGEEYIELFAPRCRASLAASRRTIAIRRETRR